MVHRTSFSLRLDQNKRLIMIYLAWLLLIQLRLEQVGRSQSWIVPKGSKKRFHSLMVRFTFVFSGIGSLFLTNSIIVSRILIALNNVKMKVLSKINRRPRQNTFLSSSGCGFFSLLLFGRVQCSLNWAVWSWTILSMFNGWIAGVVYF